MEAGGGGAEEEQVMSEVHLGCPPHFSGLHISHFSFSSQPLGPSGDNDGFSGGGCELAAATSGSCSDDKYHLDCHKCMIPRMMATQNKQQSIPRPDALCTVSIGLAMIGLHAAGHRIGIGIGVLGATARPALIAAVSAKANAKHERLRLVRPLHMLASLASGYTCDP